MSNEVRRDKDGNIVLKKDGTPAKPTGRPLLPIDEETVLNLAKQGLTYRSIAAVLNCDQTTIEKRFSAVVKQGHAELGQTLRQRLVERALGEDDKTCQIYLDKKFNKEIDETDSNNPNPIRGIKLQLVDKDDVDNA